MPANTATHTVCLDTVVLLTATIACLTPVLTVLLTAATVYFMAIRTVLAVTPVTTAHTPATVCHMPVVTVLLTAVTVYSTAIRTVLAVTQVTTAPNPATVALRAARVAVTVATVMKVGVQVTATVEQVPMKTVTVTVGEVVMKTATVTVNPTKTVTTAAVARAQMRSTMNQRAAQSQMNPQNLARVSLKVAQSQCPPLLKPVITTMQVVVSKSLLTHITAHFCLVTVKSITLTVNSL